MATREQVLNALFTQLQNMVFSQLINGQATWVTTSRRLKLWGDVPADQQPAAFLVEHEEEDAYRNLGVLRRRLQARVFCYSRTDDLSSIGGTDLNVILEAFEKVGFAMYSGEPSHGMNTLGGLVYWVRVEGRVFKDPGDLDGQALLIVPLSVEMP